MKQLFNRRGDAPLLLGALVATVVITTGLTSQLITNGKVKSQVKAFNDEAAFYASEFAGTFAYLSNRNNPSRTVGTYPITVDDTLLSSLTSVVDISSVLAANEPTAGASVNSSLKDLVNKVERFLQSQRSSGSTSSATGLSGTAVLDKGGSSNILLYEGDNLFYRYAKSATGRESYCGQVAYGTKTLETCIVAPAPPPPPPPPPVCVENLADLTIKTYGLRADGRADVDTVIFQLNNAIVSKGLPYTGLQFYHGIRMSTNATGSGMKWTSIGTPDPTLMKTLCNILGSRDYISATCHDAERSGKYPNGKCNYNTPGGDFMQILDLNTKAFSLVPAGNKYSNVWISSITCRGPKICP